MWLSNCQNSTVILSTYDKPQSLVFGYDEAERDTEMERRHKHTQGEMGQVKVRETIKNPLVWLGSIIPPSLPVQSPL